MDIATFVGLVTVVLVLLLAAALAVFWHRVSVVRRGGVDVMMRWRKDTDGRGWHHGVARYQGSEFAWYRVSSVGSGANQVLHRDQLEIVDRRSPSAAESGAIPAASVVLHCRMPGTDVELAMDRDVLTGFLSWLESAPPAGRDARRT